MRLNILSFIAGCAVTLFGQVSAASPILSIDFGGSETNGPVQSGYSEWAGPFEPNLGLNYDETRSFGADFGVGGTVTVGVMSDDLFFRDYNAIVGGAFLAQSALLSDSILRNQPGSIFLTFNSLTDGVYAMTSFHHDTFRSNSIDSGFVPFNIILTDGLVTNKTLFSGLDTTEGLAPSIVTEANYTFTVLGGSSVTVEFAGQADFGRHMSINGFQLQRVESVPEPTTLALLSIALAGLGFSRCNRVQ